jgi:adenylate cyclase
MDLIRDVGGRLAAIGADPADPPAVAARKTALVFAALVVAVIGWTWGAAYAALGLTTAALIPGGFGFVTLANLWLLSRTRRYGPFQTIQLALIVGLPLILQLVLGGFVASSAVGVWAFVGALGAIFFAGRATPWFVAFLAGMGVLAILDPVAASRPPSISAPIRTLLFALNIGGVGAITWAATLFFVRQRDAALRALDSEHARSEELLLNVLPAPIAERLKRGPGVIAEAHPAVTVLFADVAGFTPFVERTAPDAVIDLLDRVFSAFDELADRYGLEKIKTIGDAYMVVGGAPQPRPDHAEAVASMALDMLDAVRDLAMPDLAVRIGIDTGPVIAGVIGRRKFSYDLWGDTVNTASRMESHGIPGRIQVTPAVEARLRDRFRFERRGPIDVKGKRSIVTFFLVGRIET